MHVNKVKNAIRQPGKKETERTKERKKVYALHRGSNIQILIIRCRGIKFEKKKKNARSSYGKTYEI